MSLLYYITDRSAFPGDADVRRQLLLVKISEAARCGVDYIQLREKDLSARELVALAREAMQLVRAEKAASGSGHRATVLLINSRTDVALAAGADGVHLRSEDIRPADVRAIWRNGTAHSASSGQALAHETSPRDPVIAVSCHSSSEVAAAAAEGADLAVLAPVFEKRYAPGIRPTGLNLLQEACRNKIPVLALGGVNLENAQSCLDAGAAGIAGIRLFQENDIAEVVEKLH